MADRLVIHDLLADCRIGVFDWEREQAQQLWVDLELAIDATAAAERDDVTATVDYGRLVTVVRQYAQDKTFRLLETLAEELASLILEQFETAAVTVRVKKRALPGVDYAAVELTRRAPG